MNLSSYHTPIERLLRESLNDIVIEKRKDSTSIKAILILANSLPFFAGHFPNEPVFPAVLQLSIVRLLSSEAIGCPLQNVLVRKTKFSHIIRPEEKIILDIDLSLQNSEYVAVFTFSNDGQVASSGRINYKIEG